MIIFILVLISVTEGTQWKLSDRINKNYYQNHAIIKSYPRSIDIYVWDKENNDFYSLLNAPYSPVCPNRSDLSGKELQLFTLDNRPGVKTYDREHQQVDISRLPEFDLAMIKLFVDYFNITPIIYFTNGRNLSFDVMVYIVYIQGSNLFSDFSQPLHSNAFKMFMQPVSLVGASSYVRTLTFSLWVTFIASLFLLSCCIAFSIKILPENCSSVNDYSWSLCLLSSLGGFYNQGSELQLKTYSGRILIFWTLFLGFMIFISVSAMLMSVLTTDNLRIPIKTLDEIIQKRTHQLCINPTEPVYIYNDMFTKVINGTPPPQVEILPKWKPFLNGPRCNTKSFLNSTPEMICKNDAIVLETGVQRKSSNKLERFPCTVVKSDQEYFKMYGRFSTAKKWPYIKNLNKFLSHLREVGILSYIYKKNYVLEFGFDETYRSSELSQTITFAQIKPVVELYGLAMIGSVLILLVEIWFRKKTTNGKV